MLILNIIIGVILFVVVISIPFIRRRLKTKYDFDFQIKEAASTPTESSSPQNTDEANQANPLLSEAISTKKPVPSVHPSAQLKDDDVRDNVQSDEIETPNQKTTIEPISNAKKEEDLSNAPSEQTDAPPTTQQESEIPEVSQATSQQIDSTPSTTPQSSASPKLKSGATLKQITIYILDKEYPGQMENLSGEEIVDVLLDKSSEGEIKFNAADGCFSHYTKNNQLVYNIYKSTEPVTFPDTFEEVNDVMTSGLMLDINFPIENMPDVYAYNVYFRHTAIRIAKSFNYKIYDEKFSELTEKKLEEYRKTLVKQKQGSLL